ncbi:MAG: hypothetical protein KDD53_11310, partial [Bdellovibrionales bacterium]|nr:hypothetical protein [Bdellovibrionales bacterium]
MAENVYVAGVIFMSGQSQSSEQNRKGISGATRQVVAVAKSGSEKIVELDKEAYRHLTVAKRNGVLVPFRRERIQNAIESAFRATRGLPRLNPLPQELHETVQRITDLVVHEAVLRAGASASLEVEELQDIVELKIMEVGHLDVAKNYIIYRDEHKKVREDSPQNLKVQRRDGTIVRFKPMKIAAAIEKAFRATLKVDGHTPQDVINSVNHVAGRVVGKAVELDKAGTLLDIERIQDEVERELMAEGFFDVAKDFILYRAARAKQRAEKIEIPSEVAPPATTADESSQPGRVFQAEAKDGSTFTVTERDLRKKIEFAARGLTDVSQEDILEGSIRNFYDGIKETEIDVSNIMAAKARIEIDPAYSTVAARLLLDVVYRETMGVEADKKSLN